MGRTGATTTDFSASIVGIGASAGGVEALQTFFSQVDVDSGLAFVVILHLSPSYKSQTAEILSRSTSMDVQEVIDGGRPQPNQVYVAPPASIVSFVDGLFRLSPRAEGPDQKAPIDFLFESLAQSFGEAAIGIVLSGTGSDGTQGLKEIKRRGGRTFAQDPASAQHTAMPQSAINAGVVDEVLSPEAVAESLNHLCRGDESEAFSSEPSQVESDASALDAIVQMVQSQTLIDFSGYKSSTVGRRIQRQMRMHKQETLADYARFLEKHPEAVNTLCEDMFIHVTEFFRDSESFFSLAKTVFPRLLKNKAPGAPIRIWVPGCSTGEEAYSLVMALWEYLGTRASKASIQIFATDISEKAVQEARAGLYTDAQMRGVSKERRDRFFDETFEGFKVKKVVRDLCIFSRHDVTNNPPFAKIDLISCRNVLIYFAPALQKKVMPIFHYSLNPEGLLWLGRSEAPSGFSKLFTLIDKSNKVYSKINTATPMSFRFPTGRHLPETSDIGKKGLGASSLTQDSQREFDQIVLSRYVPASLLINSDLEILQVRGRTGSFLEFPVGQPSYNLLKALRPELLPIVRMTIQSAMKTNSICRKEGVTYDVGDRRRKLNIEVMPANPDSPQKERQFVIFFEGEPQRDTENFESTEAKTKSKPGRKGKSKRKNLNSDEVYIAQLLEELDSTREYQQTLSEGYESAQEELTSANEELQSTNEELQSTNEEMETAKEELQAANEELTTINDELQVRNSELTLLNLDLAREKIYSNLFSAISAAANEAATVDEAIQIFVDRICEHEKWAVGHAFVHDENGRWASTDIWHFSDAHRFREFRELTESMVWDEGVGMVHRVLSSRRPILIPRISQDPLSRRKEVASKAGLESCFAMPIQVGSSTGVIVEFFSTDQRETDDKFVDVMANLSSQISRMLEKKKGAEDLAREVAQKRAILTTALDCIVYMDQEGKLMEFNPAAERVFGYERAEVIGSEMAEILIPSRFREAHREGLRRFTFSQKSKMVGKRLELEALRRDGTEFPVELTVTVVPGIPRLFVGFLRDITERKKAEEVLRRSNVELERVVQERTAKLRESEQRFRLMIESVKDYAIFRLDPNGKILTWNSGARQIKGYEAEEVIGQDFSIFYTEEDRKNGRPRWMLENATKTGRTEDEGWRVRKDGTRFWASIALTRINDDNGNLVGFSKVARDLTERKQAEETVQMAKEGLERTVQERTKELRIALNARDEFLSIASHELKTPLTALKLQIQISERNVRPNSKVNPSREQLAESYAVALRQVNSLADLIEDLLDTSRIQTGRFFLNFEECNLSELAKDVVNRFVEQMKLVGCTLELEIEDGLVGTWDRHRLEQVFVNLIANAIKYAPHSQIRISARRKNGDVELVFADNGPGIHKDKQGKIFERFERLNADRNVGGLGLGLYIVRKIVEAHRGSIHVESDAGRGAQFHILLPMARDAGTGKESGNLLPAAPTNDH